jgi:hypothetical protein
LLKNSPKFLNYNTYKIKENISIKWLRLSDILKNKKQIRIEEQELPNICL